MLPAPPGIKPGTEGHPPTDGPAPWSEPGCGPYPAPPELPGRDAEPETPGYATAPWSKPPEGRTAGHLGRL
ncbi:hypothetical protein MTO96_025615 [Rhipicephalus appendiculatus]